MKTRVAHSAAPAAWAVWVSPSAGKAPPDAGAFVAVRTGQRRASGAQIAAFLRAKYPIDPARVSISPKPPPRSKPSSRPKSKPTRRRR